MTVDPPIDDDSKTVDAVFAELVRLQVRGSVALITMADPARRNALSANMREGLRAAFAAFGDNDAARVGVLTGEGPVFCAGADLKEMKASRLGIPPRDFIPILDRNIWVDKVMVAAVNGHALGGGFLLAQMCDLGIASEDATFGLPEVRWGRGAPWSVPLARKIPERVWMELVLTGESISAQRAYDVGLINKVVPAEDVLAAALALAENVAQGAPLTVRASRRMVQLSAEMGRSAAWDVADELFRDVYQSRDAQEGPRSFTENRTAKWGV